MSAPEPGDVVPYSYLWWRQHETGEDSGRKLRPCVIVVAVQSPSMGSIRVAVVAITHSPPQGRMAVEIPAAIKKQLKLDDERSWAMCDEINHFAWPGFDLGRTPGGDQLYGRIPVPLLQKIQATLLKSQKTGVLKVTNRD